MTYEDKCMVLLEEFFKDEAWKALAWMKSPNPMFGNLSPRDMIEADRGHKVLEAVEVAIKDNELPTTD